MEVRDEIIGFDLVVFDIVYYVGLCIVLLLCTHGFSLGRTKLHKQKGQERDGTACRVDHNAFGMKLDNNCLELSL